jgi:hypothetical protein
MRDVEQRKIKPAAPRQNHQQTLFIPRVSQNDKLHHTHTTSVITLYNNFIISNN